jgi:hypothetical protein
VELPATVPPVGPEVLVVLSLLLLQAVKEKAIPTTLPTAQALNVIGRGGY